MTWFVGRKTFALVPLMALLGCPQAPAPPQPGQKEQPATTHSSEVWCDCDPGCVCNDQEADEYYCECDTEEASEDSTSSTTATEPTTTMEPTTTTGPASAGPSDDGASASWGPDMECISDDDCDDDCLELWKFGKFDCSEPPAGVCNDQEADTYLCECVCEAGETTTG